MKIIILGAGPGGYETAIEASTRGMEVILISDGPLGGTCLNEGCIPTKAFCASATLQEGQARKGEIVPQLQNGIASLLRKVRIVYGHAEFVDAHTVKTGEECLSADKIIIATGSVTASLPIPGAELCIGSREILGLSEVPKRLCVIGGGVIGLEFASVFHRFGSEVSVLEYCPGILPRFDEDLAKRLKSSLVKQGIAIETSAGVQSVVKTDNGLSVRYLKKDVENSVEADTVLMAVGRRANFASLKLEAAGVETGRHGIVTDENMCTSVPDIYAIGDVTGGIMLAHYASFEGRRALNHICSVEDHIRFDICPSAVFTTPEVATVGLSEEDCKARGIAFKPHKAFFRANGKAMAMGEPEGYCKLLTDPEDRILGCHLLGAHASDLIHEVAVLMNLGATLAQARDMIHAHPTLSEVLQAAYCA